MRFLWNFYGGSMIFLWDFYWIPVGFPWYFYGQALCVARKVQMAFKHYP